MCVLWHSRTEKSFTIFSWLEILLQTLTFMTKLAPETLCGFVSFYLPSFRFDPEWLQFISFNKSSQRQKFLMFLHVIENIYNSKLYRFQLSTNCFCIYGYWTMYFCIFSAPHEKTALYYQCHGPKMSYVNLYCSCVSKIIGNVTCLLVSTFSTLR